MLLWYHTLFAGRWKLIVVEDCGARAGIRHGAGVVDVHETGVGANLEG